MRSFWKGFATLYLATALIFGLGINRAMPAINWMGAAYYGAVWPAWPLALLINRDIVPVPAWSFTFDGPTP